MKDQRFKTYIYWGITAVSVIAVSVALVFLFLNYEKVDDNIKKLFRILTPVIYGAVLAYLVTPIYNRCVSKSREWLKKLPDNIIRKESAAKAFGTIVSFSVIVMVVVGLICMLLPGILDSIKGIIESFPSNIENLSVWLTQLLADNPPVEQKVLASYDRATSMLQEWLYTDIFPNMDKVISGVSNGLLSIVVLMKNILIGLIVMIYLLNIKDTLTAQSKKLIYGLFPIKAAQRVIEEIHHAHVIFGKFIIGKLLDSLIIGIICFVCLSIMKMPYTLLVSVIVGVTNIIPFFGPFIGAVPSAILILLVSPLQCLYFLIFVLLLQQFDGNILGPKILGDSTGLSSFWVLFSILLFGGLFGFVGMIIGVPTFAVIYNLVAEWITRSLKKKNLPTDTEDYMNTQLSDKREKLL